MKRFPIWFVPFAVLASSAFLSLSLLIGKPFAQARTAETPVAAVALPSYWQTFEAAGADPTGLADSTAAIQAALNAAPPQSAFLVPTNAVYKITAPISIYNKDGLSIQSLGGTDLVSAGQRGAEFQWWGTVTPQPYAFVDVNHSRHICLKNLTFSCDRNTTPPARGISIDQYADVSKPPVPSLSNTTRCQIEGCTIVAPPEVGGTPGTFCGVAISDTSIVNVEFCTVFRTMVQASNNNAQVGWGDGIRIGGKPGTTGSYNCKTNRIRDCEVSYATNGIRFTNGGGLIEACTGTGNGCDIRMDGWCDPTTIRLCRFEQSTVGLATTFPNAPQSAALLVEANDWASVTGPYCVAQPGKQLSFRGNKFYAQPPAGQTVPTLLFQPMATNPGGNISLDNNRYDKVKPNPYDSYLNVSVTMQDTYLPY